MIQVLEDSPFASFDLKLTTRFGTAKNSSNNPKTEKYPINTWCSQRCHKNRNKINRDEIGE